jgi:hypothetical protein
MDDILIFLDPFGELSCPWIDGIGDIADDSEDADDDE